MKKLPVLYLLVPCYNEEAVLPISAPRFIDQLQQLIERERIHSDSKIFFINDGSTDRTLSMIHELAKETACVEILSSKKNLGHQRVLLTALLHVRERCDAAITIDADGQDDLNCVQQMLDFYHRGFDIVYGVRNNRSSDCFWDRMTAELFYLLLKLCRYSVIYNHADCRLHSRLVLQKLYQFCRENREFFKMPFLRGIIPALELSGAVVTYPRWPRLTGISHYTFKKKWELARMGFQCCSRIKKMNRRKGML